MKRGEIWTSAGNHDYANKPRPVVIIQNDRYDATESVTVCPLTSDPNSAPDIRIPVMLNDRNGLRSPSRLMVDKIATLQRSKLHAYIGKLDHDDMIRLERAIAAFFGMGRSRRAVDDETD